MAKSLGPELLAYFALAQVYVGIVNSIFNVQTWESMIKFGNLDKDGGMLSSTIKTNFLIDLCSALVAFSVALLALDYATTLLGWDSELTDLAFLYCFIIPFTLHHIHSRHTKAVRQIFIDCENSAGNGDDQADCDINY